MSERGRRVRACLLAVWLGGASLPLLAASDSVFLEELTSTELRDRIAGGATTALVPIGGTEQNGAHMVLGKHNVRVRALAGRIAQQLGGRAIVAPVLAYVPEGGVEPPSQHMRWAGTLTISDAAFEAVLDGTARSLRRHGFHHVVLLGDHGGYQGAMARVADRLNREWTRQPTYRVVALSEYYRAAQADYAAMLKAKGYGADEIGQHAGLADTALALAVEPALVRRDAMDVAPAPGSGVSGDPRRASAELGRSGLDHIVDVSVAAIRRRTTTTDITINNKR